MEKKLSLLDYLAQIFMIFGITAVLLNIFCLLFGESAQEYSSIFLLGNKGLSIATMMQFLLAVTLTVTLRFVFFTDIIIKKMPLAIRIVLMFFSVFLLIACFIVLWNWFPINNIKAWCMFAVCFAVSCAASTFISMWKEKQENQRLTEALQKLKLQYSEEEL